MQLTKENLLTLAPSNRFALFVNGKLHSIYIILAAHRFIQLYGGLSAQPVDDFVAHCNNDLQQCTIYLCDEVPEPTPPLNH